MRPTHMRHTFRGQDLHMTMRIPPHAIQGYAPGIKTAGPSSGVNQYGGYLTPQSRPSSGVGMPLPLPRLQSQPQPANRDDGKRHKLDEKITEEELRKRSSEWEVEDEVTSFEEVEAQKKLLKEGNIEVLESPRFITEARPKELERGRGRERSRRRW